MNECHTEELKRRRVLILNTGGSIGSMHTVNGKYLKCPLFRIYDALVQPTQSCFGSAW